LEVIIEAIKKAGPTTWGRCSSCYGCCFLLNSNKRKGVYELADSGEGENALTCKAARSHFIASG